MSNVNIIKINWAHLHAIFKVLFDNVYFVLVIFNVHGGKKRFLKVVKIPYPKNRFLVTLRSFFSTYNFFQGRWWSFPVSTVKEKYFTEKMSALAGPKEKLFIFP